MAEMQVLISAYGPDALERISKLEHAEYPGVEYIVGWQKYDTDRIPESVGTRKDFKIFPLESIGLCNNRNSLLNMANAQWIVISDDDLIYKKFHIENLFKGFQDNPGEHFLTFRYESEEFPKTYAAHSFNLQKPPKGYFVTSMELAFNLDLIRNDFKSMGDILFHTAFGVNGTLFGSGEEDILIHRLLKRGYRGKFVPSDICINTDSTTSERIGATKDFIETKGAVISYVKPSTMLLRMITHAWKAQKTAGLQRIPFFRYCQWWMNGVKKAKRNMIFDKY